MPGFGQQNQAIRQTPAGYIDSAFLDGNDGSGVAPSWDLTKFPDLTGMTVGTASSIDLAAFLTDPGSPASAIGFHTVSGQSPQQAGFTLTGTVLSNANAVATFGVFQLVAVRNTVSVLTVPITFAINAAPGTDNVSPTIPTGIIVAPGAAAGTIALTFDPPCDISQIATPASGAASVTVLVNGSPASPPSPIAVQANALPYPTPVNIGSISNPQQPAFSQAGTAWTLSCAGTGIVGTASEQCFLADFGTYSGAFKFVAQLDAYGAAGAATALQGMMLHETAAAGGKFLAVGLGPQDGTVGLYVITRTAGGGVSSQVAALTVDTNGAALTGPVYVKIERAADNSTLTVSYSLKGLGWTAITTQSVAMVSAVHYALFSTSQTAGTQSTSVIEEVAISNSGLLSATLSAASPVSIQLKSLDKAGNSSVLSAAITGVPKQQQQSSVVKWNPGPYGAQGIGAMTKGSTYAYIQPEYNHIAPYPGIIGFRMLTTWGFWEQVKNDVSAAITLIYQILTDFAKMTPPRHLFCTFMPNVDNSSSHTLAPNTSGSVIPADIISDAATYGPGLGLQDSNGNTIPDPNGHGGYYIQSNGGYCANLCNTNVLNRIISCMQKIGAALDDPSGGPIVNGIPLNSLFEGIQVVEDSNMFPALNTGLGNPAYTNALKSLLSGMVAAFPHTNVAMQADTNESQSNISNFMLFMVAGRIAPGSADCYGSNTFQSDPTLSFIQSGMKALFGTTSSGIPNQRPLCRPQLDVQSIELSSSPKYHGTTATAQQIAIAMRDNYQASHYFFTMMYAPSGNPATFAFQGLTIPLDNDWDHAAPVLSSIATVIGYPPNYP